MKLTDKRFWKFEAAMLLCGVATVCVEALNYGISLFFLIGQLLIYPLCFCVGGVATWKVSKAGKVWQNLGGIFSPDLLARLLCLKKALLPCFYQSEC